MNWITVSMVVFHWTLDTFCLKEKTRSSKDFLWCGNICKISKHTSFEMHFINNVLILYLKLILWNKHSNIFGLDEKKNKQFLLYPLRLKFMTSSGLKQGEIVQVTVIFWIVLFYWTFVSRSDNIKYCALNILQLFVL